MFIPSARFVIIFIAQLLISLDRIFSSAIILQGGASAGGYRFFLRVVVIVMALLSHLISSLLFAMVVWFSSTYCYNLDTLVPTIVESGLSTEALFGFSVEQHEFSDGRKM